MYDPQSSWVMYSCNVKFNESEFGIEKNPAEVQADKRVTLELSSEKEESEEDQVDNVEFDVRPPARKRRAPDRFGEWVTINRDYADKVLCTFCMKFKTIKI